MLSCWLDRIKKDLLGTAVDIPYVTSRDQRDARSVAIENVSLHCFVDGQEQAAM